ncbi:MAG: hypothetical protein NTU58_00960 [Candidatus Nealsonbacteria bacterium]|nr:hypothetical protein [Candidatus Nealsonbacteria bacterium]
MAIEIIPKSESKFQEGGNILFIISLIVLVAVVSCYFYLFLTLQKKSEVLTAKQYELDQLKAGENFIETEISVAKEKIDNFNDLFRAHKSILGFFDFLEKNTHIKVMWENANFSKTIKEDSQLYQLNFSGNADSFITLAQQIIIFKNRPDILSMKLSSISMEEKGKVKFGIEIIFNPDLFIFK